MIKFSFLHFQYFGDMHFTDIEKSRSSSSIAPSYTPKAMTRLNPTVTFLVPNASLTHISSLPSSTQVDKSLSNSVTPFSSTHSEKVLTSTQKHSTAPTTSSTKPYHSAVTPSTTLPSSTLSIIDKLYTRTQSSVWSSNSTESKDVNQASVEKHGNYRVWLFKSW